MSVVPCGSVPILIGFQKNPGMRQLQRSSLPFEIRSVRYSRSSNEDTPDNIIMQLKIDKAVGVMYCEL
jgi:hypothetical protein